MVRMRRPRYIEIHVSFNYVAAPKPPRGLMRGGVSTLHSSGVVVLVMLVVLSILVLSSTFDCDWSSRLGFERPGAKQ